MFETAWVCESTFSTVDFVNLNIDQVFLVKWMSVLRCAESIKYTLNFSDSIQKYIYKYFLKKIFIDYMLK